MNNALYRISAIFYGLMIGFLGVIHMMSNANMSALVPTYMPSPAIWVYITGISFLLASISIILNLKSRLAGSLLAVLFAIIIIMVQLPQIAHATNAVNRIQQIINTLKDTCIFAGALLVASKGS